MGGAGKKCAVTGKAGAFAMRKKIAIIFLTVFLLSGGVLFSQAEKIRLEVFEVKYADIKSLEEAASALKSDEGRVSVHTSTNKLVVFDYPSNLERIAKVIELLDIKPKELEIKVVVVELTSAFLRRLGLGGRATIIPPAKFDEFMFLVKVAKEATVRSEMSLRTISGRVAALSVSEKEIFGGTLTREGDELVVVPIQEREAGSYLEVLPRVNDDGTINIIIRPSVSEFRADGSARERSILTQLVVNDGDTVAIGGLDVTGKRTGGESIPPADIAISKGNVDAARKVVMFLTTDIVD